MDSAVQAEAVGTVSIVSGSVVAVDASGSERVLFAGDLIYADELIRTGPDARVEISMMTGESVALDSSQSWLASADTFTPADQFDNSSATADPQSFQDVDDIQAAILAGQDPTAIGEATAAGAPGAGAFAGPGGNEGADFVILSRTAGEVDPTAGYQTDGIGFTVEQPEGEEGVVEPDPVLFEAVISLSDITLNEGSGSGAISATLSEPVTGRPVVITLDNGSVITIPVGETTGESTPFEIQGDDPYIDGESYEVGISSVSGGNFEALDSSDTATVTIDDTIDTTVITLSDVTVDEGSGSASIGATLGAPVTESPLVITLDNGATITIGVGETSGTSEPFDVQGDDPYVDGESYAVGISSVSGGNFEALDSSDTATVTVNDTIDTTVITLGDISVSEGSGTANISATIESPVTESPLVITLDNGATITIGVGETSGTSEPFDVQGDDVYVDGESYEVGISSVSGGNFEALDSSDTATVTVNDTIDTTVITLGDISVNEGSGSASISATLGAPVTESPLVITLDNGATITIGVGETSGTSEPFDVQGDDPYVDGESYAVGISSVSGGNFEALDSSDTATVTVNDTIDTTVITLSDVTVDEGSGSTSISATLGSPVTESPLVITLDNGATITIGVGETSATSEPFDVQGDYVYVDGESYAVGISSVSGGNFEALDSSDTAIVTINDTIDTTVITLGDITVNEGSGSASITATLGAAVTESPLVITLDNGATITIGVGETSGTSEPFDVQGDDVYEDGESYAVSISSVSGGNFEALDSSDTATVTVNDTIDTTVITLSDVTVNEGSSSASISATLGSPATESPLVITLDNGATITIGVGETSGTSEPFDVQGDDPYVDGESYAVGISSVSGGNFEALDSSDTATVIVNDTIDTTVITLSDVTVDEGSGTANISATLGSPVTESPLVITLDNGATITIGVGETSGTSEPFAVQGDDVYVDGESYEVGISSVSGGNFEALDSSDTAAVTVSDTIDTTVITLSDVTVNEGSGSASISATLGSPVTESPLVITLDNGATITIGVGETSGTSEPFDVQGDDVYVDGESYEVGISSVSGGNFEALDSSDTAAVTVSDTIDTTVITLSDVTVNEGSGSASISATLGSPVTESPLVITLDNGATITIGVGETSGTSEPFDVQGDDVYVDGERYEVGISSVSGGNFEALDSSDTATVTVNDTIDTTIITLGDISVNEGSGTASISATLGSPVTESPLVITLDNGATITIGVGETSGTSEPFDVQGDDVYVDGESYEVGISSVSGGNFEALDSSDTATVTVNDTIDTTVITLGDISVSEGSGTASISATLGAPVTESPLVITLDNGATITIGVGETSGTSEPFDVQGDDVYVDGESYEVGISSVSGGNFEALDSSDTATVTVNDTIDAVTATLSTSTEEISDEGGEITYTIQLSGSPGDIDPNQNLVFQLASGETITILAGETSGSATISYSAGDLGSQDELSNSIVGVSSGGAEYERLVTAGETSVPVIDGNTDPEFDKDSFDASYSENSGTMAVLTTVSASDEDGDTLTYSISDNQTDAFDNDLFTINSATGEISLTDAGFKSFANDFEAGPNEHVITVVAADGKGGSTEIEVTLSEENLPDLHLFGDNDDNTLDTLGGDNDILVGDVGGVTSVEQTQDYHIALILDVSGSMNDHDRDLVQYKAAVEAYIDTLSGYADGVVSLGLVTFSDYATDAEPFDLSTPAGVAAAKAYVAEVLVADGNTNYEAGLEKAYDWLSAVDGDAINQTVFVSDGLPNRFLDNNGVVHWDYFSGGTAPLENATGTFSGYGSVFGPDNISEVDLLKSLGTVYSIGVSITDPDSAQAGALNTVATGEYIPLDDVTSLGDTLVGLAPVSNLDAVGADLIEGGMGDDLIFGDALNTDTLARTQGIDLPKGSGHDVFQALENGEGSDTGWTREDTLAYIRDNHAELAEESGRDGGDDILIGGIGNDIIYGQEGDDILIGGAGDDILSGGSSADTFVWQTGDSNSDSPAEDRVLDFSVDEGDVLDLSDLLQGESYAVDGSGDIEATSVQALLDNYLELTESGGNVEVAIKSGGAGTDVDQKVVLENTSFNELAGSPGSSASDADALAALINNGNLSIDQS
ncbi:retention module-containing protein [Marinobacterium mangrovicola]|nr:retention module-containing protein [Marinobacterium mangrovicola]